MIYTTPTSAGIVRLKAPKNLINRCETFLALGGWIRCWSDWVPLKARVLPTINATPANNGEPCNSSPQCLDVVKLLLWGATALLTA